MKIKLCFEKLSSYKNRTRLLNSLCQLLVKEEMEDKSLKLKDAVLEDAPLCDIDYHLNFYNKSYYQNMYPNQGGGQGWNNNNNQQWGGGGMQGQGQGNWGNNQGNPWGQQGGMQGGGMQGGGMQGGGMQGGGMQGGGMQGGGMHGQMGGHQQWQQNPFYNQNQKWGQGGYNQMPHWQNANNVYIPPIQFNGGCKKCHGTGTMNRKGMPIPCRNCYRKKGICPKCYGGGVNYFNGKPCKKCQKGKWGRKKGKRSSSSSSSDDNSWGGQGGHGGQGFQGQGGFGGQGFQGQGGFGGQGFQQGGQGFNQGGQGFNQGGFQQQGGFGGPQKGW